MSAKLFALVTFCFLLCPTLAFAQKFPSNITNDLRTEDKRLETPVSLTASHIYLGELLARLTAQTGVSLSISATGSFSGVPITVALDRVPLANVMNGLWSLLGCRNALWEWTYSPEIEKRRYNFEPSRTLKELAARLNREMQDAFEAQAALMIEMAFMSPKERQNNVARLAKSMLEKDNDIANIYVADNPALNREWAGIRLFAQTLSEPQRLSVLRGSTITVPISQLSEEEKAFATSLGGKSRSFVDGVEQPPVAPTLLRFSLLRYMGKHKELCAKMMIGVGGQKGYMSRSYIGVLEFGLRRQLEERWMLTGDKKTHALASQKITPPAKKKQGYTLIFRPLAAKLAEAAEAVPFSFMAVLPDAQESNQPTLQGKTLEEVLAEWRKDVPQPMHKWRDDVLLMSYPAWFYGDDAQFPYQVLQQLRASVAKSGGYLPADTLAHAVTTLHPSQMERLSEEFPVFADALAWMPLQLISAYPDILFAQGVPITQAIMSFLTQQVGIQSLPVAEPPLSIRLNLQQAEVGKKSLRLLVLEVRTKNHNWFPLTVLEMKPTHPKPKPIFAPTKK